MQGAAHSGFEFRCVRVQQIQRDDMTADPLQNGMHRTALHNEPGRFFVSEQGVNASGMNAQAVRVNGYHIAGVDGFQNTGQAEKGRDAEFTGHIGQVPGKTALFGDHGGGPPQKRRPLRQCLPDNQDGTVRKPRMSAAFSAI